MHSRKTECKPFLSFKATDLSFDLPELSRRSSVYAASGGFASHSHVVVTRARRGQLDHPHRKGVDDRPGGRTRVASPLPDTGSTVDGWAYTHRKGVHSRCAVRPPSTASPAIDQLQQGCRKPHNSPGRHPLSLKTGRGGAPTRCRSGRVGEGLALPGCEGRSPCRGAARGGGRDAWGDCPGGAMFGPLGGLFHRRWPTTLRIKV